MGRILSLDDLFDMIAPPWQEWSILFKEFFSGVLSLKGCGIFLVWSRVSFHDVRDRSNLQMGHHVQGN